MPLQPIVSHIGASIGSFIPSRAERGPHSPSCVETPLRQSPSHTPTTKLGGGDGGDGSTFLSGGQYAFIYGAAYPRLRNLELRKHVFGSKSRGKFWNFGFAFFHKICFCGNTLTLDTILYYCKLQPLSRRKTPFGVSRSESVSGHQLSKVFVSIVSIARFPGLHAQRQSDLQLPTFCCTNLTMTIS